MLARNKQKVQQVDDRGAAFGFHTCCGEIYSCGEGEKKLKTAADFFLCVRKILEEGEF